MKSDKQLIKEIDEHIRETDYPGSSLNCGVYPIGEVKEVVFVFYPKENCIMKIYSSNKKEIIRNIYSFSEAEKFIKNKS